MKNMKIINQNDLNLLSFRKKTELSDSCSAGISVLLGGLSVTMATSGERKHHEEFASSPRLEGRFLMP
jgi:hypothetical protein